MISDELILAVGTYTERLGHVDGVAEGLLVVGLDVAAGRVTVRQTVRGLVNPSFVVVGGNGRTVYAVQERDAVQSRVTALAVGADGVLALLNEQPTQGASPCYVALDGTGRWLLVANYGGGNVVVYPLGVDGRIAPASQVIQHEGQGPNLARQEAPHAHMVLPDPQNCHLLVCDLGLDAVFVYPFDAETGRVGTAVCHWQAAPGAGPRHLAFHPNGRWLAVVHELDNTVALCAYTGGQMTARQTLSLLPEGFVGKSAAAALVWSPDGRFLYASNRFSDLITVLALDGEAGRLRVVEHVVVAGQTPRDLRMVGNGRWLLAACQDSRTVSLFAVEPDSGRLQLAGEPVAVASPVCLAVVGGEGNR